MSDKGVNWQEKWQQNQIGFHQEDFNSDLVTYMDSTLSKSDDHHSVFVPLCGKTRDMVWLANKFKHVYGVELSSLAMEQFSAENNVNFKKSSHGDLSVYKDEKYTLYQGDFFKVGSDDLPHVGHIFDRASMIALPKEVRQKYAKHMIEVIKARNIFLITISYDQEKVHGPPYSVPRDEVLSYYKEKYNIEILSEVTISEGVPERFATAGVSINKTVYSIKRKS